MVEQKPKPINKKVFAFFIIGFPILLIVILGLLYPNTWPIQILLVVYVFILLRQFLNNYYEFY